MKDYIVKELEQRISSFQQLPYLFVGTGFSMRYSHAPSWNTLLFDIWTVINPTKKERDFNKLKQKIEMDIASTKPDLNAEEQKYYKEILKGLEDMETVIHVSTADDTKLQKVFEYIMYDMPTLFWCDRSWSGSKYLSENRTEISPGYTCTKAERDVRQNQLMKLLGSA